MKKVMFFMVVDKGAGNPDPQPFGVWVEGWLLNLRDYCPMVIHRTNDGHHSAKDDKWCVSEPRSGMRVATASTKKRAAGAALTRLAQYRCDPDDLERRDTIACAPGKKVYRA